MIDVTLPQIQPPQEIIHEHLPIANVANLMKETLDQRVLNKPKLEATTVKKSTKDKEKKPKELEAQIKISKEAKEITQECVTELLHFITGEALLETQRAGRQTITGEDIVVTFENLGFEEYTPYLKIYLKKYKKVNFVPWPVVC